MTDTEPRRRRRSGGGRAGRQAARAAAGAVTQAYLTRALDPVSVLDEAGLQQIEENAETILSEIGIQFNEYPSSLALLEEAGCRIDGEMVYFPRGLAREIVQKNAPGEYTQHARNPERNTQIGGKHTVFAPNYGSPFITDLDQGRRYATVEDFQNVVKLVYMLPHLHHSGGTVCEPTDVAVNKRHLDMVYAHLKYSDKPLMGSVTAPERAADSVELCRMAFGGDLEGKTVMTSLINANSPLAWDATMLGAAEVYAKANQATIISPFILMGAMSPVSVAGLCAQALAEALAGMAFVQLVAPGAPVIFGTFATSMSMATGAPTFGTAEGGLAIYIMAELARRVGVPFRSGGQFSSSKAPDAQSAYESAHSILPTMQAGVNFVLHAAGWIEGGLAISLEKLILDADQLGAMAVYAKGVDMTENGQAMEAFRTNEHGQHFLGNEHTLHNFESAFYQYKLTDNNSYEQWSEEGSKTAADRANEQWKQMLSDYVAPELDDKADAQMLAFIEEKKSSMPDALS